MNTFSKVFIFLSSISLLICFSMSPAMAATFKSGTGVTFPKTQTINESVYTAGQSVTIDSPINGDVYCAGQSVTINAAINGDIICAAQTLSINGTVTGSVRLAGQNVTINATITNSASVFAQNITFGLNSSIGKDASLAGQEVTLQGSIARDLQVGANTIIINGNIGRNVQAGYAQDMTIATDAVIGGDLSYTSPHSANIQNRNAIKGSISYTPYKAPQESTQQKQESTVGVLIRFLFGTLAFFILGLAVALLFPKQLANTMQTLRQKPWPSFGWGILLCIIVPIVILVLIITLIGIPVSILLALCFGIALLLSRVMVAFVLGTIILEKLQQPHHLIAALAIGVFILWIIFAIPFLGGLVSLIATTIGLGAIFEQIRSRRVV